MGYGVFVRTCRTVNKENSTKNDVKPLRLCLNISVAGRIIVFC